MRNDCLTLVPQLGIQVPPIQAVIAYQILYFNGAGSTFERHRHGSRRPSAFASHRIFGLRGIPAARLYSERLP